MKWWLEFVWVNQCWLQRDRYMTGIYLYVTFCSVCLTVKSCLPSRIGVIHTASRKGVCSGRGWYSQVPDVFSPSEALDRVTPLYICSISLFGGSHRRGIRCYTAPTTCFWRPRLSEVLPRHPPDRPNRGSENRGNPPNAVAPVGHVFAWRDRYDYRSCTTSHTGDDLYFVVWSMCGKASHIR